MTAHNVRVAVDGGQSALRLRVLPDGRHGTGPGYRHDSGGAGVVASVRIAAADAALDGPVDVACLGLSGLASERTAATALAAELGSALGTSDVRLCTDLVAAHAGALPEAYGVVLIAGTGTACLAVDADGSWFRVGGHGFLFADEGSAFAIGRAGLAAVLRNRDHAGPATSLAEVPFAAPTELYASPTLVDDIARFAPTVVAHADAGDAVARAIVDQAATDLATLVGGAVARMGGRGSVPVACVGGLLAAGDRLWTPFAERLPQRAEPRPAAGTVLDGAARLTADHSDQIVRRYADLLVVPPIEPERSHR